MDRIEGNGPKVDGSHGGRIIESDVRRTDSSAARALMVDVAIGVGLAALVVVGVLFSSFNSTFIYRGF